MHEASIVRELLTMAADRARGRGQVTEVQIEVGRLSGVSPDALLFYFETLRDDALGPQSRLEVRLTPLQGTCVDCGAHVVLDELRWSCAACGGAMMFENGSELTLTRLVVERG